ncbi:hypothetical protein LWI29_034571 [Acer saccharum]|uniref:Uncharacterized protein n=1 Tax=Acer saccharum TaxID=4024 RepID=A0AA39VWK0_ACESA|nr:hypothetical protein LWI29_034571 [Acer saccharum]
MPRSSRPGGSKRRAPRASRESLLDAQTTVDFDVEDHQRDRLHFSLDRSCSFDTEVNVVGEDELRKYKSRFDIPDSSELCGILPKIRSPFMVPCSAVGSRRNLSAKKVPRHFTSPEAWSKEAPVLLDSEISHLAAAAVLPLDSRDRSFLLDEEKMISQQIFTRLHARLPRLCDFDTVCDLQAQEVKNSEAASKRHAASLANEGIASPDGDDPSDGEGVGDVSGGGAESGRPPMRAEVAANTLVATTAATTPAAATPSRKGKEKVGVSGGAGRGKRPAENTPDRAARPLKRASRVVQYVVFSDEEGAGEPALAETPIQTDVREDNAEGTNAAVPPPEEVNELNIPASSPPRTASPPVAMGESNVSSDQPRPSGQPESVDRPGPSKQPGISASGSGFAHEAPPAGSSGADEGNVSLSDFSATEICSHLVNNDVYIGESWGHVKGMSCNRKMEFFFNCHSLASVMVAEKLFAEESHAQQLAQLRESADGHLSAQLASKEKLSAVEEEIRSLKEHLSASQESFAARLEAERVVEEAREKAEHEAGLAQSVVFS